MAVFDDDITEGLQRRAKDENGNTIFVPQDMNYQQWYDKYVNTDEGILQKIFNKDVKINYKDITKQKENIINIAFKNENIKKIALNTNINSIKVGGNRSYHRNGNVVLKIDYNSHAIRHEIGHAVDYYNKWLSSNKNFIEAIEKDKSIILKNKQMYKNIIKNNSNCAELSDIMSGITHNKIRGRYKHDNKYWKKANKVEREIFAQMFTTAGNDDFKQLGIFQEYLPNTFREFDNLIRRIL